MSYILGKYRRQKCLNVLEDGLRLEEIRTREVKMQPSFRNLDMGSLKKKTKNKLINNESVGRSVMSDSLGPHGL